jgi:hypothetical protein
VTTDRRPRLRKLRRSAADRLNRIQPDNAGEGSHVPVLLRVLRLAPAMCSAPLVATLVDMTGIGLYFNTAFHILRSTQL